MTSIEHTPVLLKEVISLLDPKPNENFIDATFGLGGHSLTILDKNGPKGKVLGIEADLNVIKNLKLKIRNYAGRLILVNDNFANLKKIVEKQKFKPVSGILMDLGISSWHLDKSGRGFTFLKNEPLNMKIQSPKPELQNSENDLTAERIVNDWQEADLEKIFREYGQERFSKNIAKNICKFRKAKPIKTTFQLSEIIRKSVPTGYEKGRINPATRVFLALRIVVNRELENLTKTLPQAMAILAKNGKLAVISFNSLEDRLVKNFFKETAAQGIIKILTKKPITPSLQELKINPRSRSAKLRAALKIS